jgi:hypothetical protein
VWKLDRPKTTTYATGGRFPVSSLSSVRGSGGFRFSVPSAHDVRARWPSMGDNASAAAAAAKGGEGGGGGGGSGAGAEAAPQVSNVKAPIPRPLAVGDRTGASHCTATSEAWERFSSGKGVHGGGGMGGKAPRVVKELEPHFVAAGQTVYRLRQ